MYRFEKSVAEKVYMNFEESDKLVYYEKEV